MASTLLVVESDPKFSKVLPLFFRDTEFEVEIASGVAEGLKAAKNVKPALVLLNLDIDNHKGWDLARQLKGNSSTKGIPLILMSAEKDETDIQSDTSLNGWEAYIRKPFVKKAILAKVEEVMASAGDAAGELELEIELEGAFEDMGGDATAEVAEVEEVVVVEEAAAEEVAQPATPPPPKVEVKPGASEPELRQAIKELERNVQGMQRERERLEKEARRHEDAFKSKLESKDKELQNLEAELEKKSEFASQLSEQLKNLSDEVNHKEKGFRQESKDLREERDQLAEKVGALQEELEAKSGEAKDLSRNLAAAEELGTRVEKERDALQERAAELDERVGRLQARIEALTGKISLVKEAIQKGLDAIG